jgi:hypothetical protein
VRDVVKGPNNEYGDEQDREVNREIDREMNREILGDGAGDLGGSGEGARGPRERSRSSTIQALLKKVEARLNEDVGKATLADYIKLIQLQKELGMEDVKEIRVRWVDGEPSFGPRE